MQDASHNFSSFIKRWNICFACWCENVCLLANVHEIPDCRFLIHSLTLLHQTRNLNYSLLLFLSVWKSIWNGGFQGCIRDTISKVQSLWLNIIPQMTCFFLVINKWICKMHFHVVLSTWKTTNWWFSTNTRSVINNDDDGFICLKQVYVRKDYSTKRRHHNHHLLCLRTTLVPTRIILHKN